MLIASDETKLFPIENLRDGCGVTNFNLYCDTTNAPKNTRLITEISLEPGCSIGKHTHQSETELYYVVRGIGELDDNGEARMVRARDLSYCNEGHYHAIKNTGTDTLLLLAIVVTE